MRQRQAHYAWWLANPCFPHLFAELAPRIVPTAAAHSRPGTGARTPGRSMHVPGVTNIGRVENYVAPMWPRNAHPSASVVDRDTLRGAGAGAGAGARAIRVDEMHLAIRMGSGMLMPCVFQPITVFARSLTRARACSLTGLICRGILGWCMRGRCRGGCRSSYR